MNPTFRIREEWEPERRKDYAAGQMVSDDELEYYGENRLRERLLGQVFHHQGELVQSLADGKLHTVKITMEKQRDFVHYQPGWRYTVYVDHAIAAQRHIVDIMVKPDFLSTGELWHEFLWRTRSKVRKFGLWWLIDDFLGELEKVQGWR